MSLHVAFAACVARVLSSVCLLLCSSLFFFLSAKPLFFLIFLLLISILTLLLLLIVSTHTMSNLLPLLHSVYLLSFAFSLLYLLFFFSCPYLNSATRDPPFDAVSHPYASLHPRFIAPTLFFFLLFILHLAILLLLLTPASSLEKSLLIYLSTFLCFFLVTLN